MLASCEPDCTVMHACVDATVALAVPRMPGLDAVLCSRCTVGRRLYVNEMS